jgi:hypothetical protein
MMKTEYPIGLVLSSINLSSREFGDESALRNNGDLDLR